MDPRDPFIAEVDLEEGVEADDYYYAMRIGWLTSGADEDFEPGATRLGPPMK